VINLQITNQEAYFTFGFHKKISLTKESFPKRKELALLANLFSTLSGVDRRIIVGPTSRIRQAITGVSSFIDPATGKLNNKNTKLLDASCAFPYYALPDNSLLINAPSIGIPLDLSILLLRPAYDLEFSELFSVEQDGLVLIRKILEDFANKGIDQIRQETAYKAAVIQHAIDQNPVLDHAVSDTQERSKTLLGFRFMGKSNVESVLKEKGYVIEKSVAENLYLINNFTTHSKEQFEQLSDQLATVF